MVEAMPGAVGAATAYPEVHTPGDRPAPAQRCTMGSQSGT